MMKVEVKVSEIKEGNLSSQKLNSAVKPRGAENAFVTINFFNYRIELFQVLDFDNHRPFKHRALGKYINTFYI